MTCAVVFVMLHAAPGQMPASQPDPAQPDTLPQLLISQESELPEKPWNLQVPSTLQRIVRRFTFEEAEIRPLAMPINFYRYIAPEQGFPPFGTMQPTAEHAHNGNWSFGFELDGGSMAARIPTGVIPAVATGRYIITAQVRTENVQHGRASIAAWLHNAGGAIVPETRVESRPVQTNGTWQQVAIELDAEHESISDLVFELRLTQPSQQPGGGNALAPDARDVTGRAWFDDVTVWHAPSIELTTQHVNNIIAPGEQPRLQFHIRDLASEPLRANLDVFDVDGTNVYRSVFDRTGDFGIPREVPLPPLPAGWYRAVLDLHANTILVGRQWVDFVVLASSRRAHRRNTTAHRFAVKLDWRDAATNIDAVHAVQQLGIDTVLVPIWPASEIADTARDHDAAMLELAIQLLRSNHEIIITLDEVPSQLASELQIDRGRILDALGSDSSSWRPYLDEPMLNLGLEARRWKIGGVQYNQFAPEILAQKLQRATVSLGAFVPQPQFIIPWPILQDGDPDDSIACELLIPSAIRPAELLTALQQATERSKSPLAYFEQHGTDSYTPRQRIIDLAHRALFTWRSGLREFVIDAPWQSDGSFAPAATYVLWRTLADQLSGRHFVAELNHPDVAECWIVRGDSDNDAALIVWADTRNQASSELQMLLSDGPVTVIDAFGNVQRVDQVDGRHHIPLSETPVFIEGIDANLAMFRAGFALDPPSIPSVHRLHEVAMVLRNPWDISLSGTIRVDSSDDWRMNPRVSTFTIRPGGEVRLPVDLIFDRNVLSDAKELEAKISLLSDRHYEFRIRSQFAIGLNELHVSAHWQILTHETADADLLITQYVTNRSTQPVTISAFMHAPGLAPRVRPLGRVEAGATAVQTFRIPGGAVSLAGKNIRYGVKEVDGSTRLNRILAIPDMQRSDRAEAVTP